MSRTASNMLPLGTKAPGFVLFDSVSEKELSLVELKGEKGTLIMFICNHCPFVKHVNHTLTTLGNRFQPMGIKFIAISSNDVVNYPQDSPSLMKDTAHAEKYTFPYLYDESQDIAKAYKAACTPDFFLFNRDLELVYRGQLDDSRPGNGIPVSGSDLSAAMEALLKNKQILQLQKPSIGCNIKWK